MYSMHVFFKEFLFLHSFCSSLFVFQLGVRADREREGIENCLHGDDQNINAVSIPSNFSSLETRMVGESIVRMIAAVYNYCADS